MDHPFCKYYPQHHLGDPQLRMCSAGARGIWVDLWSYSWSCEPVGHVVVGGRPATLDELSRLTGTPRGDLEGYLRELRDNRVHDVGPKGEIVCRRVVRDFAKIEQGRRDAERGKGGRNRRGQGTPPGGPPGGTVAQTPQGDGGARGRAMQRCIDASQKERGALWITALAAFPVLDTPRAREACELWLTTQRSKHHRAWTVEDWCSAFAQAVTWGGPDELVTAIEVAKAAGWKRLFDPRGSRRPRKSKPLPGPVPVGAVVTAATRDLYAQTAPVPEQQGPPPSLVRALREVRARAGKKALSATDGA